MAKAVNGYKNFKKEKIAFVLISLFYVQTQEPANRSATTTAFVFLEKFAGFYHHKIFETRS